MKSIRLETKRLLLRDVSLGDESYLYPEVNANITQHWIDWEPPKNIEEQKKVIKKSLQKSKDGLNLELLSFDKNNTEFIGYCGISLTDYGDYEINVWVKHADQRKGYATEMVFALIEWAKANTSLSYLIYSITQGNTASQPMISKLKAPLLREWEAVKRGEKRKIYDYKIQLKTS